MDTNKNPYIKDLLIPPAFPIDFTPTPIKVGCSYATNLTTGKQTKKRYFITEIWGRKVKPKQYKPSIYSPPIPPALEYIKKLQKLSSPFDDLRKKINPLYDSPVTRMIKDIKKVTSPLDSIIKTTSYASSLSNIVKPMNLGFSHNSIIRTNTGLSDLLNYENTYINLYNSIDVYGQSHTATQYDKIIKLQKELARKYKKAQSKKSKKKLLQEIEQLQNSKDKTKRKNKKLKDSLANTENENKALVNALGSLQASYDKAISDIEALPPPMASQPQQTEKKSKVLTLDSTLNKKQISIIYEPINEVFTASLEQLEKLFSINIEPMKPIKLKTRTKLKAGTTLMDLRLFIDELKGRELINVTYPYAIIGKAKAFYYEGSPVTAKQLKYAKDGNYPYTKNYDKIEAIFEALEKS